MQHRSWIVIGATFAVCVLHAGTGWCQRSESHEVAVRGASAYVPVESYAYTLFDRLAAEGLIETQFVGVRPWTCTQCARLVAEADSKAGPENSLQQQVLKQLRHEFAPELLCRVGLGR